MRLLEQRGIATIGGLANVVPTASRHGLQPARQRRFEIRCGSCGYGGIVSRLPDRCPMCGGASWHGGGEA